MTQFKRVPYESLNARQRKNYNFQKVASRLADYGFNCLRLSDDWNGADFIAFLSDDACFVYPHDEFLQELLSWGMLTEDSHNWLENYKTWPMTASSVHLLLEAAMTAP